MKIKQFPTKLGILLFATLLTIAISISCENNDHAKPDPLPDEEEELILN